MFKSKFIASLSSVLVVAALAAWPASAVAQRRFGPVRSPGHIVVSGFGYGYPFFDYDPWWQYPYPYPPYGYGYATPPSQTSALRIEVTPKQAEVYLDGYRAGVVDDFDGIFQRLYVRPGQHELTLYLDGFRTVSQSIYVNPGSTQKIQLTMEHLAPGESMAPRPVPPAPDTMAPPNGPPNGMTGMRMMPPVQIPSNQYPPPPPDQAPPGGVEPPPPPMPSNQPVDRSTYGTLSIRVQPGKSIVLVDGERWDGPGDSDALLLRLSEGKHHVEVRRPGYATFATDVNISRGAITPLNVSLVR